MIWIFGTVLVPAQAGARLEFTRMIAHWSDYSDRTNYLSFIEEARPEIVQVGFYGAHFWSLVNTPHGGGYPAHLPVRGYTEGREWFKNINKEIHRRGAKVIGHMNVKFLVGDPESAEGPRGFFKFYRDEWDEKLLGPKPAAHARDLLEVDRSGNPISQGGYNIGGMREYWACLNNPAWREVLKRWVRDGVAQGVDGFVANYFYRHDCHCAHCASGFRHYLAGRYTPGQLKDQFGIANVDRHVFDEIGAWHDPSQSTQFKREMLRFSQIANKSAFDEVFVQYGRSLKPDLIVAQWNHLGDFNQINGDERCLLPTELWGKDEDYLWYSCGDAANHTDLVNGLMGEGTLQARYIRGAFDDKPYTLGKYESVRIRTAIAELAANGGAPMGFYTNFKDPETRREISRYYGFLRRYQHIYQANRPWSEVLLLFPRSQIHQGNMAALTTFKDLGRRLLDAHVLFEVLPDDVADDAVRRRFATVINPSINQREAGALIKALPNGLSSFQAAPTVRVAASRAYAGEAIALHFVNYNREEPADRKSAGNGIKDEKPIATKPFEVEFILPADTRIAGVEFLTPEQDRPIPLEFRQAHGRLSFATPSFLVYGVAHLFVEVAREISPAPATKRIAAVVTVYRHNSHADIIVSRLLQTDTLDGKGKDSPLQLVSLYTDQRPRDDTSRILAASHRFRLSENIGDALTMGTGTLAVDGVLLIAEHGEYPKTATGNIHYPKRRFWEEILKVFQASGRVVPVFIDKHLADNWPDAKFIYDSARELNIPIMAGSSVPLTWRHPPADVPRGARLKEIVGITFHTTDAYGFHALEAIQALAEQRRGGETGIKAVQAFAGEAVWKAFDTKSFDTELFQAAWNRLPNAQTGSQLARATVLDPRLFRIEYADGLIVNLLELNGAASNWSAAWRDADGDVDSTLFWTQEGRPGMHFTLLLHGIEQMMLTGKPSWNVERTLLTSGTLDTLLLSLRENQRRIETPFLLQPYQPFWRWTEPPPPPPMRPWAEQ